MTSKQYAKQLLKKAEHELRISISEEDRYMGSIFVTPMGQRDHEAKVTTAYANYRRLGGTKDI